MPVASESDQKDCEWVVERCKSHLKSNDRDGAKAWIITARSLFPDNFAVQYEAFCLHLCCGETKEAAKSLADLCSKFPREPKLREYISELTAEVIGGQSDSQPEEGSGPQDTKAGQIKKDLFALLPAATQKSILLQASEESSEVLTKCRLWLTAVKLFPETVATLGLNLYDALSQQPSGEYSLVADNPYREMLVRKVIPLLAESREVRIEHPLIRTGGHKTLLKTSHLCQWLESAASYYATLTAQSSLHKQGHTCAGKSGWEELHKLFMSTAEKCGWRDILHHSKQIGPHLPAKIRWLNLEKISGYSSRMQPFEAPRTVAIACFYISVFLFFEMAWEYCKEMLYPTAGGLVPTGSPRPAWVLIEEKLSKQQGDEKPTKRRKLDDPQHQTFLNIHSGSRSVDQRMVECFLVAIDCWDFLQSNITYRGEFSRLCQQWGAFEWSWLSSFRADMAIYKGDNTLAMQILQHEWHKVKEVDRSKPNSLRFVLQLVNCAAFVGDTKAACNFASEIISFIPDPESGKVDKASPTQPPIPVPKTNAARQLRLLSCTTKEMLPYCIEVIIQTLKDVAFSDPKNERALGQLLVLLQYKWPKEEEIFASVITTIQKRRKFNFPEFFNYVITIDILEEILYLSNCDSLQVTLLPQENSTRSRTVTRGVNRGAREDLMAAMEKQIKRCDEPIEPLLRTFFKQEKLSFSPE